MWRFIRPFLIVGAVVFIVLAVVFYLAMSVAYADSETIRPTGYYTSAANFWTNQSNAWDDSLTTASSGTPGNDDITYWGATTDIATDAWDAPSQSWDSGTLYCTYESTGFSDNDTVAFEVRNGADTLVATLQSATNGAVSKTTGTYALAAGYLSDQTDLRCVGNFDRTAGGDTGTAYVYEVWMVGTYTTVGAARRRMIMMQ